MLMAIVYSSSENLGDANQVIITTNYRIGETGLAEMRISKLKLYAWCKGYFVKGIAH
jgi:hypothetical protein